MCAFPVGHVMVPVGRAGGASDVDLVGPDVHVDWRTNVTTYTRRSRHIRLRMHSGADANTRQAARRLEIRCFLRAATRPCLQLGAATLSPPRSKRTVTSIVDRRVPARVRYRAADRIGLQCDVNLLSLGVWARALS